MVAYPKLPRRANPKDFFTKLLPELYTAFAENDGAGQTIELVVSIIEAGIFQLRLSAAGQLTINGAPGENDPQVQLTMSKAAYNALYDFLSQRYNVFDKKGLLNEWQTYWLKRAPVIVAKIPSAVDFTRNHPAAVSIQITDEMGQIHNLSGVLGPTEAAPILHIKLDLGRISSISSPAKAELSSLAKSHLSVTGDTDYLAKLITIIG